MLRMILALLISLAAVLVSGPKVIPALRRLNFGQTIYDLGPQTHKTKQGTPIMGGLMMAGAVLIAALVCHPAQWQGGWDFMLALLAVSLLSMAVGFGDDFIKAALKRHEGLTPRQKIAGQVITAVAFSAYCYFHPQVGPKVWVPFMNVEWNLGIFYIPLMSVTVIFMVNSANLQDGVDGILSTVTAVGSTAWAAMALLMLLAVQATNPVYASNLYSVAIFAAAMIGATLGFLRFNHYPATVFMGDTGSMFIGGAVVGMSMLMRQPLMMVFIAFTLIMSSLSVIIQRYYFKATHGKRIFKMSPIHHHFELSGYSETQIVRMYAIVTAVLSLIAILSMYGLKLQ